ncbi:MAG TPA: FAD-binding oxidoreductase [Gaiellaceae bacterium]|nr:FAD-binding oxidoreductase [Gaiellaceae bacterium]
MDGALRELAQSLDGCVLTPEDDGYEEARVIFNALVDARPAVIARCSGPADVATALDFARSNVLEIAVRGGGHNPAGHCMCDGGLVIDLSGLRVVRVDASSKVAHAGGGATWADFDTATQAAGLVTPGGVVVTTGVAGLTLGGGIGHLTAQHGLTCDNLIGAEVVTPDGRVLDVSEDEDAELLWGLRGGGGNFGVVTRLDFKLFPLDGLIGGLLVYQGADVREALLRFRDLVAGSPTDLSCQAVLKRDEGQQPQVVVAPAYTGSEGDPGSIEALRAAPGLVADSVHAHSFLDQQHVFDSPYGENRHYWKGHFVRELPDELIDELVERVCKRGRPSDHVLIESLHGAPKETDPEHGALGFRNAAFNISAMAVWEDAEHDADHIAWARETAAAIEPWSLRGGGYVNYMQADEPIERVRAAFGSGSFDRLQALKRQYDPSNLLRRNQNIPPA